MDDSEDTAKLEKSLVNVISLEDAEDTSKLEKSLVKVISLESSELSLLLAVVYQSVGRFGILITQEGFGAKVEDSSGPLSLTEYSSSLSVTSIEVWKL